MRHKSFILVAVLLLILVCGAVAAYAYDSSRKDRVAEGVTVAGVNIGGMTSDQARRTINRELSEPLEQPIAVTWKRQRFNLSAQDAGAKADVDGMVDEALAKSREGNLISRVARDLTGGEEDAQVAARVSYDERAVRQLVRRVKRKLNRPARDAEVRFPSLEKIKEQTGLRVKTTALRQRVAQALTVPGVDREVEAAVVETQPKVTTAELADKYPAFLVADRSNFQLRFYKNLELAKSYTVAVGALGFEHPRRALPHPEQGGGPAWTVPNSDWAGDLAGTVVPGGTAENPLKARWLGIYDGAGIHGTDQTYSLGTAASHGCIRMAIPDVIELYDQVPVGAPIYIA